MKDDDPATKPTQDSALWRYIILSPLLHQDPDGRTQEELLAETAGRNWIRPDGRRAELSHETIRKWLYRYRQGGLPALADQARADKGRSQVPERLAEAVRALRQAHPRWRTAALFKELCRQGVWDGTTPSRSALYRFCQAQQLGRDRRPADTVRRAFEYAAFGQLWTADFLHGPKVWCGRRKAKIYLHAIIDDCSRFIVAAAFHEAEDVEAMLTGLLLAISRFGIPHRLYSDNGAAYRSRHLQLVAARLGVQLPHTPPYKPQGRGKIERFFGTVRSQFLDVQRFKTLAEANQALAAWLADYHASPHSALGVSPLQRRLQVENVCRPVPAVADLESLFRMERRCRVSNTGTVRLRRHEFEVPGCLPLGRTTVYFLPWDLSRVYYGDDMRPARCLDKLANARRLDRPATPARRKESDHED